ncbi:hypothetical protein E2C01_013204 [Portunus trituberculatus]|uniref:Uncharacterized protein n=1 Tax=Portunus trituberculatus TaxID=210409 RepID=A0A5B7DGN1_PORTR|nr:hypothetical protein [Portunus trituberculatus]
MSMWLSRALVIVRWANRFYSHANIACNNPFSTITRFHIHSGYYLVILYSFRNSCGD